MISIPPGLSKVTAHVRRATPLGGFGIEHLPFLILYAVTLQYCMSTIGAPHAASLAHYKKMYSEQMDDGLDSWELESDDDMLAILRAREVPLPNPSLPSFWSLLVSQRD